MSSPLFYKVPETPFEEWFINYNTEINTDPFVKNEEGTYKNYNTWLAHKAWEAAIDKYTIWLNDNFEKLTEEANKTETN